ncbi:MAG TPA: GH92 family glycosyl hydrolase, partial [Candidatus Kryptobacter bacterium]|nr:GH92 family glycosyl hydrolase [Candidatus Kryptobacter bacterium]
MIQWSPDTGPKRRQAGYKYADSLITGFSLDRLSGAGCPYGNNFGFVPLPNTSNIKPPLGRAGFLEPFSHANETARPGYYSVKLNNGIKVELTTTERSGFGRFTYPANYDPTMAINAGSNVNGTRDAAMQIDPKNCSISGAVTGGHFCGFPDVGAIYFYAVFNRPFATYGTWGDSLLMKGKTNGEGNSAGAWVTFDLKGGGTVLAKVAISYVSVKNARLNLEGENPLTEFTSKSFDKAAVSAGRVWNSWLNRIQVSGGTTEEYRTFYTMMYHALLDPTVCSDVNGEYMGYDGNVHTVNDGLPQYADFSGWDIYRSECQFLAMIAPDRASAMAQSLVRDYQQGGAFPRWGVPNMDSGVMIGDPAAAMIADFYAFGARDFDAKAALKGLVRAATDTSVCARRSGTYERPGLADYLKLGYVPSDQDGGNVSMTLEYNSADFALSQFAGALGDGEDSTLLLRHAQNWKYLYNPSTGLLGMRRRNGSWVPASEDTVDFFGSSQAFVEGSASQYVWMVPFNLKGLAEKMGGRKFALARLDTFFIEINGGFKSKYAFLGNEPCLETPWIFCFLGEPYKAQQIVRKAVNELYSAEVVAYPGNDDLGEMSSWYLFGAL